MGRGGQEQGRERVDRPGGQGQVQGGRGGEGGARRGARKGAAHPRRVVPPLPLRSVGRASLRPTDRPTESRASLEQDQGESVSFQKKMGRAVPGGGGGGLS